MLVQCAQQTTNKQACARRIVTHDCHMTVTLTVGLVKVELVPSQPRKAKQKLSFRELSFHPQPRRARGWQYILPRHKAHLCSSQSGEGPTGSPSSNAAPLPIGRAPLEPFFREVGRPPTWRGAPNFNTTTVVATYCTDGSVD